MGNVNPCTNPSTRLVGTNDVSEEARFIMNPTMLVAIKYPFTFSNKTYDWCSSADTQLIPREIKYSKSKNEIFVHYYNLPSIAPIGDRWFYVSY